MKYCNKIFLYHLEGLEYLILSAKANMEDKIISTAPIISGVLIL